MATACSHKECVANRCQACKADSDCTLGTGVCRNGSCTVVPCTSMAQCMAGEACTNSMCTSASQPQAPVKGVTVASGGGVSTSGKHIHISLTGQGRGVGTSTSSQHKSVAGGTSVMGR